MTYSKVLSRQIPAERIVDDIKKAIEVIYDLPVEEYNSHLFYDIAVGFKNIVYNMEMSSSNSFPLFLKWLKLYVRLQHQIDPSNKALYSKFEKKFPLCTSYIVASLQYQTKIANYHLQAMEMCLSLFNTASDDIMKTVANLEMEIIALFWMPIEFVGDYNTQKLSLKLIVKIFGYLNEEQKHKRINEIKTSSEIRGLLLELTANDADFEKLSRELLNNFNMKTTLNCAVFSVYCKSALFGCYELFKPNDIDRFWIDFNYTTKSVSVLCEVKLKDDIPERISIQIKIDKLQIENKFDCIVLSIEPAIFSKSVSTELNNARIAVFTLPQSEVQRLMANRDLVDFYNKTNNCESSDLFAAPSQNTIENFLAEEQEEIRKEAVAVGQGAFLNNMTSDLAEMLILERRYDEHSLTKQTSAQTQTVKDDIKTTPATSIKHPTVNSEETSKKQSTKESGYSPCISVPNQDSTTFKVPTNPVQQNVTESASSKTHGPNMGSATKRKQGSKSKNTPKAQHSATELNPKHSKPGNSTSKRFFKVNPSKPVDLPRAQPKGRSRKKPAGSRNSGISPKRKQVNTVRPLNHLTQPNCDPQEAALEYVENGGYANIISFIQSSAGLASFSDQQRKQILENVERINEDLDRSSRKFFPKALSSETDSAEEGDQNKARRKRKGPLKVQSSRKFVPFSTWKIQQKQKSNSQSTVVTSKPKECQEKPSLVKCKVTLNAFDRLKAGTVKDVSPSQLTTKGAATSQPVISEKRARSNSESSDSNHNFHIVESDNEMEGSIPDRETSPTDMVCRQEPQSMEISPISTPIHIEHAEDTPWTKENICTSSQISFVSTGSKVAETTSCDPDPMQIISDLAKDWTSDYQASEIFEDLEELHSNRDSAKEIHENQTEYSSEMNVSGNRDVLQKEELVHLESENNLHEVVTVNSSKSSPCVNNSTIIAPDMPEKCNNWYIEKYLNDQQLLNQSPINVPARASPPSDPHPNVVTTNQVIIQNQIVVSAGRKRSSPAHDESPFPKMALDHVPFRGYAQLLPEYMKKMTAEKDRLLNQIERDLQENYFEKITQIADEVMKTMSEYETEINEIQEQLSFCLGKLEWLIENQQKKRSQLEGICTQLVQRIKSFPKRNEIGRVYEAAEDELTTIATATGSQLWQGFANNIVTSIEARLRNLVNF